MTSEGIFSDDLAITTPTNPRNTEGDILVMDDGTLMYAWSDYYGGSEDHAGAVISAMHSTDDGHTWGPRFTLQENTSRQNVMSVSFLRSQTGDVLFFYLAKHANDDLDVMVRRSTDGGKTFGEPVLVTADAGYYVMNNARVVQHSSGRILCPTSYALDITDWAQPFRNVMYFSDDDGKTWQRGKGEINMPPSGFKDDRGAMEPGLVELKDGRIFQIIRTQFGQVWHSYSSDIGDTWSTPEPMGVTSPEAPATIARIPGTDRLILAHNPIPEDAGFDSARRTPLMISISEDEGATWRQAKVLESDTSKCYAYTSITFNGDRALFTYYVDAGGWNLSARFTSVPIDWF